MMCSYVLCHCVMQPTTHIADTRCNIVYPRATKEISSMQQQKFLQICLLCEFSCSVERNYIHAHTRNIIHILFDTYTHTHTHTHTTHHTHTHVHTHITCMCIYCMLRMITILYYKIIYTVEPHKFDHPWDRCKWS